MRGRIFGLFINPIIPQYYADKHNLVLKERKRKIKL